MMRSAFTAMAALWLALSLAGCTTSPQVHFYTLTAAAGLQAPAGAATAQPPAPGEASAAANVQAAAEKALPSIVIGPVTIPELVDRPQLVVQTGPNSVKILETKRWAEPLKSGIPRFLAREVDRELAPRRVFSYHEMNGAAADYRVLVDFSRFESQPGDSVTIEADWIVRHRGKSVGSGHSLVRQKIEGEEYDAVVAAYCAALATMGRQMARELQGIKP